MKWDNQIERRNRKEKEQVAKEHKNDIFKKKIILGREIGNEEI